MSDSGGSPRDVTFEGVWCVFEHRSGRLVYALQDVSFEVPAGEFVALRNATSRRMLRRTRVSVTVEDRRLPGPEASETIRRKSGQYG